MTLTSQARQNLTLHPYTFTLIYLYNLSRHSLVSPHVIITTADR